MHIRYSNALLWRGLDEPESITTFDVIDGLISEPKPGAEPDRVVDLAGDFVMPAFRDGHAHPLFAGRENLGLDVTAATTLSEIQLLLREHATGGATWIDGAAYDRSIDAEFTRFELDAAVSDLPVVLHGADHHTLWLNTKALEVCGLFNEIPELNSGSVDVDEAGRPTGILREWDAMQIALNQAPKIDQVDEITALTWAQHRLFELGVVAVQDAWVDRGMTEIYLAAAQNGDLCIETSLAFRADPLSWRSDFEYFVEMTHQVRTLANPLLSANAIKFFVDGVFGSATASVLEPYEYAKSGHSHGEQVWQKAELLAAAIEADRLGYQLHLHAIGDAGVRTALDIIEQVSPDLRPVIAHAELISDQDVSRFTQLGVTVNFEPLWAREDGQLLSCLPYLGRSRLDELYRMRDLADAGASISFGSDWPVSSPDPLLGVATAVNRALPGRDPWTADQALSVVEALRAYTVGVARQLNAVDGAGTFSPGQPADFVVLSANPFQISSSSLFDISVKACSSRIRPYLG